MTERDLTTIREHYERRLELMNHGSKDREINAALGRLLDVLRVLDLPANEPRPPGR